MRVGMTLALMVAMACGSALAQTPPAPPKTKNWTAPQYKIEGQRLCDEIMAAHPELLSVTLHGVPPGLDKVYTMFAGSFPERIGNPDDPDDIDVIVKGITIVDPRYGRKDPIAKAVVLLPLRDRAGANIGLVVYAFKHEAGKPVDERALTLRSMDLRDDLAANITSYDGLFAKVG